MAKTQDYTKAFKDMMGTLPIDMSAIQKLMPGTWVLDPGFGGTASTTSEITDLDGTNGILRYRGYPIEQLA